VKYVLVKTNLQAQ